MARTDDSARRDSEVKAEDMNNDATNPQASSQLEPAKHSQQPEIPPEEGIKGWLCVAGAFMTLFCSFGFLNAVGVFQSYYEQHSLKSYSPSDISWIFSFQLMMMWAPGPLVGRLVDTFGPGCVLYPCSILCIFSLCMTSLCTEYYQIFLAQGVGFGLGAGGVFTSSFVCVGQWFNKRRGLATGVASVGSSLGGVIFPLFLDRVIADVGFYGAIRYTALLVGIVLVGGCLLIRSRLPRKKWDFSAKWFDLSLFFEPRFALFSFGAFFVMWGLWVPFDFITSFGLTQGFSNEVSLAFISMINATSIMGRIVPPYLSDRMGHFNVVTTASFMTGIAILCLWLPFDSHRSLAGIIVFCLVYGFVSGSVVSLLLPCVAKLGPIETIGMRFGTFQLSIAVSTLTGLPISGAILARQNENTYWGMQSFAVVSVLLGACLCAGSTVMLGHRSKTWKI